MNPAHERIEAMLAGLFRQSRDRRAKAEAAAEEIKAAEAALRKHAADARKAGTVRHLGVCGVPDIIRSAFRGEVRRTHAMDGVLRWLETDKPFLFLCGNTGTGKSVAAAYALTRATRKVYTLAHELADEPTCIEEHDAKAGMFLTAAGLRFSSRFSDDPRALSVLDRAATVRWLVLDELRASDFEGKGLERLEEVLGERYARRLRTVVTTNLSGKQLGEHLGARLVSRMAEGATFVDVGDADMRRAP